MTNIASLGLEVDSGPVQAAEEQLERLSTSARATVTAVDNLSRASDKMSDSMTRDAASTSNLTSKVDNLGAASSRAQSGINSVGVAADKASAQADKAAQSVVKASVSMESTGQSASKAKPGVDALSSSSGSAAAQADKLSQSSSKVQTSVMGLAAASSAAASSFNGFSLSTGRASAGNDGLAASNNNLSKSWKSLSDQGKATYKDIEDASSKAAANAAASAKLGSLGAGGQPPEAANSNRKLSGQQAQVLAYQVSDVAAQTLAGGNPLQAIALQSAQIFPMFMGEKGIGAKSVLNSIGETSVTVASKVGILGGAFAAGAAAVALATAAWSSYNSTQEETERRLAGVGRLSGVTTSDVNVAAASQSSMSRRQARDLASTYAGTGQVSSAVLPEALSATKDFSAFLGVDQKEGAEALAGALSDVSKGAASLASTYGLLNDETVESIRNLEAQGNRLAAQRQLIDAVKVGTQGLAEETRGWGLVTKAVSDTWDMLGDKIDRVLTGGSLDQRLSDAVKKLQNTQVSVEGGLDFGLFSSSKDLEAAQAEVDRLQKLVDNRDRASEQLQRNRRSAEVSSIVREANPAMQTVEQLENKAKNIRDYFRSNWIDPYGESKAAMDGIAESARMMKENMVSGGSEFASSLRAAQQANQTVGFSPQGQASAQINFEASEKARSVANSGVSTDLKNAQLQTIELERTTRLQTLEKQTTQSLTEIGGAFSRYSDSLQRQFISAADKYKGIPAGLIASIASIESSGNPNVGFSKSKGEDGRPSSAYGLGQITADTAKDAVRRGYLPQGYDRMNPETMAEGIAGVLSMKRDDNGGSLDRAVMAYRGSRDPSINRAYLAETMRGSGQMGDVSQAGMAREQDAQARALREQRRELELTTEAGGRNTEALRASVEASRRESEAKSRGVEVTDELVAQYQREARERQKLASAMRFATFSDNDNFTRAQLGRDRTDQQAYASARQFEGTQYYDRAVDQARETINLSEAKQTIMDGATSFATALRRGENAASALANVFGNVADRLMSKAIDSLVSGAFNNMGGGSSGGGPLGFLSGLFGSASGGGSPTGGVRLFDAGGYTGPGGTLEPAGVVHRGEVVWSKADVARYGGAHVVDSMRRGLSGYASGGMVGITKPLPANSNSVGGTEVNMPVSITMEGSSGDPAQDDIYIDKVAARMKDHIVAVYKEQQGKDLKQNGALWKAGVRRSRS